MPEREPEKLLPCGCVEGFNCRDCGICTACAKEYYMLVRELWVQINGQKRGMLCIGCAEKRLGRTLCRADFGPVLVNDLKFEQPRSERFVSRLLSGPAE